MWNTSVSRTPSVRSLSVRSMSTGSRGSGGYDSDRSSDAIGNEETQAGLWQRQDRLSQKLEIAGIQLKEIREPPNLIAQNTQYHPKPLKQTLSEDPEQSVREQDESEFPQKTPTMKDYRIDTASDSGSSESEKEPPRVPGPLEKQLSALMSKIIFIEQENPSISVSQGEYAALEERVKVLEAEKAATAKRHEALFALRDEDVANLMKVRVLLAAERHEHAAFRKLRDDDLHNVIELRGKLCDAIRKIERLVRPGGQGQVTPTRRPKGSISFERRDTSDLFQAARNAALEQRALELEKANEELMSQLAAARQNTAFRTTSDQAWRTAVDELETKLRQKEEEMAEMRRSSMASTCMDWTRLESLLDEHGTFREKTAQRLQQLRSENEALHRELHRKEDDNLSLESRLKSLQRTSNAGMLQRILE
ncbi:hypothetical protein AJ78_04424 [Emergomyces pasteurianus Ep9510]|uniref:Uncharacterized protein n=1 Tax=Emergomyces pasteurianus Ep9510 TaxID=1447872 RepID=A0A1J9Q519_9EURO|nr:hypothetical protein AJ78_04424 [Emergomyces pasteurianus Ep9510]